MNTKNEVMGDIKYSAASEPDDNHSRWRTVVSMVLALWFGIVLLLGIQGAFVGSAGSPPLRIFAGLAIPLALFSLLYWSSRTFRAFILNADLRLVTAIQAWRWAGFGFLELYAHGILPGLFAFPAGLGDMTVGVCAPWILIGLVRDPSFATSRRFVLWNIMGIVDLVVTVSMATITSGFIPGLAGSVTTRPMAQLPLVFIPAYLVPIFIMLHFTALAQVRRLGRFGLAGKQLR